MSAVESPAHRTRPLRSAAPIPQSPIARRMANFLVLVGALLVVGQWNNGIDALAGVLAGLVFAAFGTIWRASAYAEGTAARPRQALSKRLDLAGWTPRRIAGATLGVLLVSVFPWLCVLGRDLLGAWGAVACGLGAFALGAAGVAASRPNAAFHWHRERGAAARRTARSDATWTFDHPWDRRGETRLFLHYFHTRPMYAGRVALLFGALLLPVPSQGSHPGGLLFVKLMFAAAGAWWMARSLRILGMGSAFVGYLRVPYHPGERAEFTFGVSEGGAEIRDAVLTLTHFRESRDGHGRGGGLPWATMSIAEGDPPAGRVFSPGVDQKIEFDIPADAPGTAISSWRPSYWMVEVKGVTRAGGYEERFLVPVYAKPRETAPPSPVDRSQVSTCAAPEQ